MTDLVLVNRLRQAYWPSWLRHWTLGRVLLAKPREFRPHDSRQEKPYDCGRVHFLLREIRAGKPIEPVEIETTWHGHSPIGLILLDGHHRFVASVLAGKRRIPANVGGLVDLRDWLVGERREFPL